VPNDAYSYDAETAALTSCTHHDTHTHTNKQTHTHTHTHTNKHTFKDTRSFSFKSISSTAVYHSPAGTEETEQIMQKYA